jgi:hypothetical protein
MRRFADLTDAEVLALNEAELERLIQLECAEAGVPLHFEDVPAPPPPLRAAKDVEAFTVSGLTFKRREDAERVAAVLNESDRYDISHPSGHWSERIATPARCRQVQVEAEIYWSPQAWERHQDAVSEHKFLVEEHDAAVERVRKARLQRDTVLKPIRERIGKLRVAERRREQLRAELVRYTDLANGDPADAERFLEAAYPGARAALGLADPAGSLGTAPPASEQADPQDIPF